MVSGTFSPSTLTFVHSKEPPLILGTDTVYDDYKIVSFVPDEDAIHGHVFEPA